MEKWKKIWTVHGLTQCVRPPDFNDWDLLPEMSVAMLRGVFLKLKAKTAVGQSGIAPRALWHLSDAGLIVLSKLFQRCEML
eukprot:317055-Pyramimonas_sp.AAC.1